MLNILEKVGKFKAICECPCGEKFTVNNRYDAKRSSTGFLCNCCKTAISKATNINQDFLNRNFHYNEFTGELTYKWDNSLGKAGSSATAKHGAGYLTTRINGKDYLVHRIIWLMQTGQWPEQIDHINHIRNDNRWQNLREVDNKTNLMNKSISKNSTTKYVGVSRITSTGRYRAYIMVDGKQIHLGVFDTVAEAYAARCEANKQYKFHANHGSA